MTSSGFRPLPPELLARRAVGYKARWLSDAFVPFGPLTEFPEAEGGLQSSVEDVGQWLSAESQYDTYAFVSAYDGLADCPDRPDNGWPSPTRPWARERSHPGRVHRPGYGPAAEHHYDRQLPGREDDDVSGSRAAPSPGVALQVCRGG